jgi:singapore isolate B (sub-type 7) whole genome shotgun sequence assembly, scaffold_0
MSLRSNLSVLESRYGDAKAKLESLEEQNRKNQEELEAKLAKASETKKETETAEMNALREANENLKVLLSGAEKKYMRISGLNLELQKKVDNLEQKNRMSMDQVYDMRWDLIVDL